MIDGTWVPTTAFMAGQPFPPPVLQAVRLTVTGVEGPNAGKTFPAIFALDRDTLRICYDLSGQARPTEFSSPAGAMHFLVDYQRA